MLPADRNTDKKIASRAVPPETKKGKVIAQFLFYLY